MLKPYFVQLKITAVVMAESVLEAMTEAEMSAFDICRDSDLEAEDAVAITSLEHLARLGDGWDGDCLPYGGDGDTRLRDILPEVMEVDTNTADMWEAPNLNSTTPNVA